MQPGDIIQCEILEDVFVVVDSGIRVHFEKGRIFTKE